MINEPNIPVFSFAAVSEEPKDVEPKSIPVDDGFIKVDIVPIIEPLQVIPQVQAEKPAKVAPVEDKMQKIIREHAEMTKSLDDILAYVLALENQQKMRMTKLRSFMGAWGL